MRNKNRENTCQRKKSHAQDSVYVVRQFAYIHGFAGISLLSGKIQSAATVFTLTFKTTNKKKKKNPNHQKWFLHPAHRFLHLPLHGLSLSKSPIKKPHNIIRVGLGRQPDQTQLGSTKAQQTMPRSMGFMVKGEKCRGTYYYFYGFFLLCF